MNIWTIYIWHQRLHIMKKLRPIHQHQQDNKLKKIIGFGILNFDYDKRNQKFQTSEGIRSRYSVNLPIISKTNTFSNSFDYKIFSELFDQNVSTASFFFKASNSLTNDDIKLSERLFVPTSKLRGFEKGKIGPKDGEDFIGGNYVASINFTSTIPQVFENVQNVDFAVFFDAANVWGVDYDSSLDSSDIKVQLELVLIGLQ